MKCNSNKRYVEQKTNTYKIDYYDKCRHLREYAKSFFSHIQENHKLVVNLEILPLVFFENTKSDNPQIKGEVHSSKSTVPSMDQIQINVYNVLNQDIHALEQTVRHEIIHYALQISGLKHNDDTAIFYAMCEKYDAYHYVELLPDEKVLFEKYNKALQYLEKLEKETGSNLEKTKNFFIVGLGEDEDGKSRKILEKNYNRAVSTVSQI